MSKGKKAVIIIAALAAAGAAAFFGIRYLRGGSGAKKGDDVAYVDSVANFIFVKAPNMSGTAFQAALRQKGILVRHFDDPLITDYNRVTIGTRAQMEDFLATAAAILEETK